MTTTGRIVTGPAPSDFEAQAAAFRDAVLALAAREDARVEVVAAALADVLGVAAARLDAEEGRRDLGDRLHAFCDRAGRTYEAVRRTKGA